MYLLLHKGYLSECFALENLLFLERAIILYHTILKYKDMDEQFVANKEDDDDESQLYHHKVYEIVFGYLSQIHIDMDSMVEDAVRLNEKTDKMKYKRGIIAIVQLMYSQFCRNDSATQV